MRIRTAKKKDLTAIQEALYEEDLYHYRYDNQENKEPVVGSRPKEVILDNINTTTSKIFIADVGGDVAGLVWVEIKAREENGVFNKKVYGYINDICVLTKFKGKGFGRKLLEHAINWTKEQKVNSIELRVDSFNKPALSLYKSEGFEDKSHNLELRF